MRYEVSTQNLGKLAESFKSFCPQGMEFLELVEKPSKVVLEGVSKGEEKEYFVDGEKKLIKDAVGLKVVRDKDFRIFSYKDDISLVTVYTGFWSVSVYSSSEKVSLEATALMPEGDNVLSAFSFKVRNINFPVTLLKKEAELGGVGVKNEDVFKHLPGIQSYAQVVEKLFTVYDFKEVYGLCEDLVGAYLKTWEEKAPKNFWQRFVNFKLAQAYLSFLEKGETEIEGSLSRTNEEGEFENFSYFLGVSSGGLLFTLHDESQKENEPSVWNVNPLWQYWQISDTKVNKINAELFPEVDKAIEEEFSNGIGSLIVQELEKIVQELEKKKQNKTGLRRQA